MRTVTLLNMGPPNSDFQTKRQYYSTMLFTHRVKPILVTGARNGWGDANRYANMVALIQENCTAESHCPAHPEKGLIHLPTPLTGRIAGRNGAKRKGAHQRATATQPPCHGYLGAGGLLRKS